MNTGDKRTENRARMPQCAEWFDECKPRDGEGQKMLWAVENECVIGKVPAGYLVCTPTH